MTKKDIRSYEVSLWTLQDGFISVLKFAHLENKGQIQEPKMTLKDDGTQEFKFKLPMYIYEGGTFKENPIWYNKINGNLIANMRKVKVIFNKATEDEKVFEFLIIKVTESHDAGELFCEVECEGLAFHELGKVGYKLTLNQDDFIEEWAEWADDANHIASEEPKNNIQYWCDKIFDNTNWNYEIQMDWAAQDGRILTKVKRADNDEYIIVLANSTDTNYPIISLTSPETQGLTSTNSGLVSDDLDWSTAVPISYADLSDEDKVRANNTREGYGLLRNDTIYEDEYVSSWEVIGDGDSVRALNIEVAREKYRVFDEEESNIYNLTQTIAETFGVHCRYEYEHDDNYHIIGRKVIFYNNFLQESTGAIDITYPYHTENISREMDGTDVVTKMFVKELTDETLASGWATIADAEANKSLEDYILNFDYLYEIGTITQQQYDEIEKYEAKMRYYNTTLIPMTERMAALETELTEVKAAVTIASNSISLDQERLDANNNLLNQITGGEGVIHITAANPRQVFVRYDEKTGGSGYYIQLKDLGIKNNTLQLYKTYTVNDGTLDDRITVFTPEVDDAGNLTGKIIKLDPSLQQGDPIYAIYDYEPTFYYQNIRNMWMRKKAADEQEKAEKEQRQEEIDTAIEELDTAIENLTNEQQDARKAFERMMGPALREGTWEPEDNYANYGDRYSLNLGTADNEYSDTIASIAWDNELFDEEQKLSYTYSVTEDEIYYPCINLGNGAWDSITAYLNINPTKGLEDVCFIYSDMETQEIDSPSLRYFNIGSRAQLGFIREKETENASVIPVLILTGAQEVIEPLEEGETRDPYAILDNDAIIGVVNTELEDGVYSQTIDTIIGTTPLKTLWVGGQNKPYSTSAYEIVYPRIRILSPNLKNSDDQLSVLCGENTIQNYEDYYVLQREDKTTVDEVDNYNYNYYITIKPRTLFEKGISSSITANFVIANTSLAIYLDALEVSKENAYPKVSYTIDPTLANKNFVHTAYNGLSKIVHINDIDLKFENVQGYISEIELDLDQPWEDDITITNYKTKFEDLFSSIVASSAEMKKNSFVVGAAASALDNNGNINLTTIQDALNQIALKYNFNNGDLTLDNENGMVGTSENGIVTFRKDGIFTATEKDADDNWIWNTSILPSGINADMITTGQLNTNLIKIYAGDDLKLQMNAQGLFAYKSWLEDIEESMTDEDKGTVQDEYENSPLKEGEYVVFNSEGLFLTAKSGTQVLQEDIDPDSSTFGQRIYQTLTEDVNRVSISWNGFTISNWKGVPVFFADTDGNLTLDGIINASGGTIGNWGISPEGIFYPGDTIVLNDLYIDSELYLGTKGLKICDLFQVKVDNGVVTDFIIGTTSDEDDVDNYALRITNNEGTGYDFRLGNIQLSEESIDAFRQVIPSEIYKATTFVSGSNIPNFESGSVAPDGALGVYYTETPTQSQTQSQIFSAAPVAWTSDSAWYPSGTSADGHVTGTHFGISVKRWNITKGSESTTIESDYSSYVRAGVAYTSTNTSAAVGKIRVANGENNVGLAAGGIFKLTFFYSQRNGSVWDQLQSGVTRATSFNVGVYTEDSSTPIASGTVTIPPTTYTGEATTTTSKTVTLKTTQNIEKNQLLYVVFYSKTSRSLTYIDVHRMSIGDTQSSNVGNDYSLWVKSKGEWKKLVGNDTLGAQTTIGTGLQLTNNSDDDGTTLTVSTTQS